MDPEVTEIVEASVEFAKNGDRPEARGRAQERLCLSCSYREAVRDALSQAMREDDDVFIMGEDIAEMGGSMGVTQGMLDEFGPERVRNTPISEMALAGAGIGAAMQGMRPVVEIMYEDFLTLAIEQIVNQAAKHRYMSGGQLTVPVTFRTQGGAGWSPGAQHAQQLEAWFVHIPGFKVVFASTPADVRGLLWSSIYDDNPVVFFEHRTLYGSRKRSRRSSSRFRSERRACTAKARTSPSSRRAGSCTSRSPPPGGGARASPSRSWIRAPCSRSTRTRSSTPSRRQTAVSSRTRP